MTTTRFIDHLTTGDHASRPAASAVPQGTLYSCTTHSLVYQSDGVSAWSTWATLGAGGDALTSGTLAQFAPTTSAQLAGVLSDETGTGAAVFASAPTLVNPVVGTQSPADNSTKAASTAYVDTADALKADATDLSALDDRVDALESATTPPEAQGTWLASGGSVVFLQDYDFRVSAAVYYINGTPYSAAQTDITLDAADLTDDRFDAIVVTTSNTIVKVTGTAAANPAFPDIDPETQFALTYILVQAGSSAPSITLTNLYLENTEWTSSVSGGTINAASTSNPFAGSKDIEATASAAGHYVRLTNGSPISLADKKQIVFNIRSKASWPNAKTLQLTWYLSGVKIGQSVAFGNNKYGFVSATTGVYQQIVIPVSAFAVPSSSMVDRLEFKVAGSGGTIGFYLDNIILEEGSADVTPPSVAAATASTLGLVRTDVTDANPLVYLKSSVDTALALKANLASPTFTGTPAAPTAGGGTNTTQIATTQFVTSAVAAATTGVSSVFGRAGAVVKNAGDYLVADVTGAAPLASPTFTGTVTVPDDAYDATGWNGNLTVPTKNAIRDKIETLTGVSDGDKGDITVSSSGTVWEIDTGAVTGTEIASSVALAGSPTTTTQSAADNSTKIATTAFVTAAVAAASVPSFITNSIDVTPASPNTEDDEFESTTLDAKWTETLSGSATRTLHVHPFLSRYALKYSGSGNTKLKQTYTPGASTAFSFTVKFFCHAIGNSFDLFIVFANTGGTEELMLCLEYVSGNPHLKIHTTDASVFTSNRVSAQCAVGWNAQNYCHITRDASDVWAVWWSADGYSWFRAGTYTKAFTVQQMHLDWNPNGDNTTHYCGVDWIRRGFITL